MDIEDIPPYFIYKSKDEYLTLKTKFFSEIKKSILITDTLDRLVLYLGVKELYKYFKLNKIIKDGLNRITQFKQISWVEDVCWHIFKNVEVSFESLPFSILKKMDIYDTENYLYQLIINSLEGLTTEGFLSFIEEKNIYNDEDMDLVEELSLLDKESIPELDEIQEDINSINEQNEPDDRNLSELDVNETF